MEHFPDREIPTKTKERNKLHREVEPVLLQAPTFFELYQHFRAKIDLAIELVESAIAHKLRFSVLLFDGWCLVFTACSLLHLDCLLSSLDKSQFPIKTIGEACHQQGQALIQKLIMFVNVQLQQERSIEDVFTYLFA